ncbi:MAG: IS66 family transposase [Ruminococcaceae bacterium]|nr:IS66 family transposase [Oscillospiraceae bacterium]
MIGRLLFLTGGVVVGLLHYNGEEPEYKDGKFRRWVKVREAMTPEQRKDERQKRSKPILDDFFAWVESLYAAPKSKLAKAIDYAKNEKVYLSRFLEDGRIPISNNRAENAIRPYVVGRKNWLFNITEGGAENQAILYSIVNTAKANGLNVEEYFTKIFSSEPGTIIMPW